MGRTAPALPASNPTKPAANGQAGSNGFWRRDVFNRPGTYTWTAQKAGKAKIQALGAGCGAQNVVPGASGAYGEKTIDVVAGQSLTIVVGGGTNGTNSTNTDTGQGGTTSISGTPIGGTPLVLLGAKGASSSVLTNMAAGTATGPWDVSNPGAKPLFLGTGGPSSGSPFGPGKANGRYVYGAAGWGGTTNGNPGASSHRNGAGDNVRAPGAFSSTTPLPFWDFRDVDSPGGLPSPASNTPAETTGPGAGGGACPYAVSKGAGASVLGGGTAVSYNQQSGTQSVLGTDGGFGAGGGASGTESSSEPGQQGGKGGDGYVQIFWDEVGA